MCHPTSRISAVRGTLMMSSPLWCVALQRVAACCSMLQCVAVCKECVALPCASAPRGGWSRCVLSPGACARACVCVQKKKKEGAQMGSGGGGSGCVLSPGACARAWVCVKKKKKECVQIGSVCKKSLLSYPSYQGHEGHDQNAFSLLVRVRMCASVCEFVRERVCVCACA